MLEGPQHWEERDPDGSLVAIITQHVEVRLDHVLA